MKALIAGAGAIGGWLAARLDEDVTLLGRKAVQDADGITVEGLTTAKASPRVITQVDDGPYDLVLLTCKAHATASVAKQVLPSLAEDGVLCSLQNGLGNAEKLARLVDKDRVAVALTSHGVAVKAPGHLVHAGAGTTQVGPCPGSDARRAADALEALLARAGLEPERHANMRGAIWQKAIVNAGINPVAALHGVPNGRLLDDDLVGLVAGLVQEATALAERARVTLPSDDLVALTKEVCRRTATNRCSMLQDVEAQRATELEQITGRMVRLGETLLVSMPRSDAVYGRMKDLERSYLGDEASNALAWEELEWARDPF